MAARARCWPSKMARGCGQLTDGIASPPVQPAGASNSKHMRAPIISGVWALRRTISSTRPSLHARWLCQMGTVFKKVRADAT